MARMTLGVIVGNRDFFPDVLVGEARRDLLKLFGELEIDAVLLDEQATKLGAVETWEHAKRCAELFRANRDRIQGVLVCLPERCEERHLELALQGAKSVLGGGAGTRLVLLQNGRGAAGLAKTLRLEAPHLRITIVHTPMI